MSQIFIIDDDQGMCELLCQRFIHRGYRASYATSGEIAFQELERLEPDVVITDLNMRGISGIAVCEQLSVHRPEIPVIVLTGFGSFDTAIAAIRAGAYDFLTKPLEMEALEIALHRALNHRALKQEIKRLRRVIDRENHFEGMIGQSPPIRALFDWIERIAPSDTSVLISGESGTGKELVARAVHRRSHRQHGPFVAINCAALPETLLESELFGHTRGAFTDARASRTGLFAQAQGGTLFLDEIGDLPLGLQPKLLRALQERRIRPVGSDHESPVDVRIICATHQDLPKMVEQGSFRSDLYWRVDVVRLEVPPLRERGQDILLLAQFFMEAAAQRSNKQVIGWTEIATQRLIDHLWPGNVRELQNVVERAVALARLETVTVEDLPRHFHAPPTRELRSTDDFFTLEQVESAHIARVLSACGGNKQQAALILGIDRKTLYRKLERKLSIQHPPSHTEAYCPTTNHSSS